MHVEALHGFPTAVNAYPSTRETNYLNAMFFKLLRVPSA